MKTIKILLVPLIAAFLLFSCDINETNSSGLPSNNLPTDRNFGNFWALNCRNNQYYRVDADKLYEGEKCIVWAEKGSGVSNSTAKSIADDYDNYIYDNMIDTFSIENDEGFEDFDGNFIGYNIMDLADWMVNGVDEDGKLIGDGKLCILLLDIQDNYTKQNGSYVAGYFMSDNFFNRNYSNYRNMIYVDTNPGIPGSPETDSTLAHEMQHLINFVTSYLFRNDNKHTYYPMDVWIDEGLSAAAEWLYASSHGIAEPHPAMRWRWFNEDSKYFGGNKGLISSRGNNFFVWDNRGEENQNAVLDDYATVYLFFQWLRLQAEYKDNKYIYYDIISSGLGSDIDTEIIYDFRTVTEAAGRRIGEEFNDWETLLKTWMAANYINAPDSIYGYRDDPTLKQIKAKTAPSGIENFSLFPGEGVYSIILGNSYTKPNTGGSNIRYSGLTKNSPWVNDGATFQSGALLTYNVNTTKNDKYPDLSLTETGVATGTANIVPDIPSRHAAAFMGPYPISAGEMIRRNGHKERSLNPGLVKLRNKITHEK